MAPAAKGGEMGRRLGVLVPVGALVLALAGGAAGGGSPSKITIRENGTSGASSHGTRGRFTIEVLGTPFGPAGKSVIYELPGDTRYVRGQPQVELSGTGHFTTPKGSLELTFSGLHWDLNTRVTASGDVLGPAAEIGNWKIAAATGIYKGWRGGGKFAAIAYGYRDPQPYAVEWDGYITGD
jgi:hypothetical protein